MKIKKKKTLSIRDCIAAKDLYILYKIFCLVTVTMSNFNLIRKKCNWTANDHSLKEKDIF